MKDGMFEYFDRNDEFRKLEIKRMQIVQDTAEQVHAD